LGGGQKQIASLYINKDSSNIALSNAYANINGTNKEIFSATKYYCWKAYPVNAWELVHCSSAGSSYYEYDIRYLKSAYQNSKKVYSSISSTVESDGRMKVLGGVTPSISSGGYYSTTGLMTVDRGWVTPTLTNTGTDYTRETVYKFTNAYLSTANDGTGNIFDTINIKITQAYYVVPKSYNKNTYTTVRFYVPDDDGSLRSTFGVYLPDDVASPNSLQQVYNYPSKNVEGLHSLKSVTLVSDGVADVRDTFSSYEGGYGIMDTSNYTDGYMPSATNSVLEYIYIFNGYWWVYDGYHS